MEIAQTIFYKHVHIRNIIGMHLHQYTSEIWSLYVKMQTP